MVVARDLRSAAKTLDGYFQPGAFVKWREATVTFKLPQRCSPRTRARSASLVFSAPQPPHVDEVSRQRSGERFHGDAAAATRRASSRRSARRR